MNRAFLIGLALQLAVLLLPPLMAVFSVTAMTGTQWITVLALAVTPLLVCETAKGLRRP
ncbi:MAG: cation transporting ATPase C-terminal domain-containing protein [Oscillospiraceae bacterium]